MDLFLHANYKMLPSIKEVAEWKKEVEKIPGFLSNFPNEGNHPIWEARAMVAYRGDQWGILTEEDLEKAITENIDFPIFWLDSVNGFILGVGYKENERQHLDSESWLGEEISMIQWEDLIVEAARKLDPERRHLEARLDVLYPLTWESSVDWESGHDEGGFVINGFFVGITGIAELQHKPIHVDIFKLNP